jgi:hypothetical protein
MTDTTKANPSFSQRLSEILNDSGEEFKNSSEAVAEYRSPSHAGNGGEDLVTPNMQAAGELSSRHCRETSMESANCALEAVRQLSLRIAEIEKFAEETALLIKQRGDDLATRIEEGYALAAKVHATLRDIRRMHEGS